MILFPFLTLVQLVYPILIMFEDEQALYIMCPLSLTERGFISANAKVSKYTDLCQYSLTVSEGMLFQFICYPQDHDYFSTIPYSLAKLTALGYND